MHSPVTEDDFVCESGVRQNTGNRPTLGILSVLDILLHAAGKLQFIVHIRGLQILKLSILYVLCHQSLNYVNFVKNGMIRHIITISFFSLQF